MGQQLQSWRSAQSERLWLSLLIDTMEQVARPELRATPCDQSILVALGAQLARPASAHPYSAAAFSLRN